MEQFQFKPGNATIRHLKEIPKKKKKMNTDRVLFILLLVIIACYGLYKLYKNVALIQVDGMVTMDKMQVHFTNDIRILSLEVEEGAEIQAGDTLFKFKNQYFEDDAANYVTYSSNIERINRELLDLNRELSKKRTERSILQNRLKTSRFELEKIRELVVLAAYTRGKFESKQQLVHGIEDDLALVKEEIRYLGRHITQLDKLKREYRIRSTGGHGGMAQTSRYYVAPSDGIIGRINVTENEVCYKSNDVMTIHQSENIRIQAYFNQEVLDRIQIGEEVQVEFPDGTKQKGLINRFYISTYELPPEFQKKYEPTQRSILVDIIPMDEADLDGWKRFYKMSVKVSLGRFF